MLAATVVVVHDLSRRPQADAVASTPIRVNKPMRRPWAIAAPGQTAVMSDQQWWKSAVVYQIYPRSFADSERRRCRRPARHHRAGWTIWPRSASTSIWLSPVYRSPQDDNGYDISDYQDVDPLFGTLADLDELLAGVHERGMKLVMDLVVNHTSDEHPWFVESRSSSATTRSATGTGGGRRATGMAPGAPGAEPNNWGSFFSGSAWEYDEATRGVLPAPVLAEAARPQLGEPARSGRRSTR